MTKRYTPSRALIALLCAPLLSASGLAIGCDAAPPTDGRMGDDASRPLPDGAVREDAGSASVADGGMASSDGSTPSSDGGAPTTDGGTPTPPPPPGAGFTVFEPDARSRVVYVSSSMGDDANDGLSQATPVRSITRGATLIRDGEYDFLLLRRGDSWRGQSLGRFVNGRDASHPVVVSGYGEGPRPLIRATPHFLQHADRERSFQALLGLEIVDALMDPADPDYSPSSSHGISLIGGGDMILIEDCVLRYAEIVVQSFNGRTYRDITLRRNVVRDAWAVGTTTSNDRRPSGLFASGVDGLLIEDNVFDHNGWNASVPGAGRNMYNHNMYINYSNVGNRVIVRNNIVTRGSSHGVHGRPGGLYENNFFSENAVSLQLGYNGHPLPPGTTATARDNVILHGIRMDTTGACTRCTTAVWGLNLDETGVGTFRVEGNIAAHRRDSGNNIGIDRGPGGDITLVDNIQHRWGGGIGDMADPSWPDPDRDLASYSASLGGEASMEAFLELVMSRPWGTWDERHTATAVNDYVRAGFGR